MAQHAAGPASEIPAGPSAREILSRQPAAPSAGAKTSAPVADVADAEGRPLPQPPSPFARSAGASNAGDENASPGQSAEEDTSPTQSAGSSAAATDDTGREARPSSPAAEASIPERADIAPAAPGRTALTPRDRQKLREARKRGSRARVYILLALVVAAIALLLVVMSRAPEIESAIRSRLAQPVEPVPAEPARPVE